MLAVVFFFIAFLYSTVGFGGGSSYLAMLAVSNVPFDIMPKVSLVCNLIVVTGGSWHYFKKGHFNTKLILPFVLSSVPMAFLGGMYPIKERAFLSILGVTLFIAGVRLLFVTKPLEGEVRTPPVVISSLIGAGLGFLSGLVALGGGIFLSPLLLNLKWGKPKEVAAAASAFIFLNSLAGLFGQLMKGNPEGMTGYWPLFLAVLVGGQLGSRIGTHPKIAERLVQRGTAVLILIISSRLLYKLFF